MQSIAYLNVIIPKTINKPNSYISMHKINIALLAGGDSGEYKISIKSADEIQKQLNPSLYNVFPIHVRKNSWSYNTAGVKAEIDKNDFSLTLGTKKIRFDLALIAIHGTPGEDGKLQSYFEMQQIPVSTCNSFTSSLTFNKYFSINVARALGVKCAPGVILHSHNKIDVKRIIDETGLPCFVKPNKGGSSVGMSKVNDINDLETAIYRAFEEDDEVLVEKFIKGRELTCAVYRDGDSLRALPLIEIVSKKEFFDFEAKYDPALADEIVSPSIKYLTEVRIKELSTMLYEKLNCSGIVRCDYIVEDDNIWFLEVNTIPGMTAESLVPKMIHEAGMAMSEFYNIIINEALKER